MKENTSTAIDDAMHTMQVFEWVGWACVCSCMRASRILIRSSRVRVQQAGRQAGTAAMLSIWPDKFIHVSMCSVHARHRMLVHIVRRAHVCMCMCVFAYCASRWWIDDVVLERKGKKKKNKKKRINECCFLNSTGENVEIIKLKKKNRKKKYKFFVLSWKWWTRFFMTYNNHKL